MTKGLAASRNRIEAAPKETRATSKSGEGEWALAYSEQEGLPFQELRESISVADHGGRL